MTERVNWLAAFLRPRWLQGMVWPTLLLWLYAFALALVIVWHPGAGLLWTAPAER